MKRIITLVLVFTLALSVGAFGAAGFADADRPTLNVFIEACATVEDYETNLATLWIEDKLGANLEFIVAPTGSAEEKMNILLNSGNYPDVFYNIVPDQNLYGVESGILMDLTGLIPDMPYLTAVLEALPFIKASIYASDGKIYAFPSYNESLHMQYPFKMFINSANLEELGMEAPTTLDEFYNVLKAWVEKDSSHIGLTGLFSLNYADPTVFLTNAFTYYPGNNGGYSMGLRLNGDTVETMITSDGYREALRFMNKLYAEGLLYEGSFTQNADQLKALLASEGEPVMAFAAAHNVKYVVAADTPELYAHTTFMTPLVGPEGEQNATYVPSAVNGRFAISSTCPYPELAAAFADLHYSVEGYGVTNFGPIELGNWRYPTEEEIALCNGEPLNLVRLTAFDSGVQNYKWQPGVFTFAATGFTSTDMPVDKATLDYTDPTNGAKVRMLETQDKYIPYTSKQYQTIPVLTFSSEESEELSLLTVSLESYISQSKVNFITGKQSLDSDWDAYVSNVEGLRINEVIEYYQTAYDRTK